MYGAGVSHRLMMEAGVSLLVLLGKVLSPKHKNLRNYFQQFLSTP
jgi:hypothetical protein